MAKPSLMAAQWLSQNFAPISPFVDFYEHTRTHHMENFSATPPEDPDGICYAIFRKFFKFNL